MRYLRQILRLCVAVTTLSLVVFALLGGLWYTWQRAQGQAPEVGYTVTASRLERAVLGLYLFQVRGSQVSTPADPPSTAEVTFSIERGESVAGVAYRLQGAGLITDAELFRRVVQYEGADRGIQAGIYALSPSMTMTEITRVMQHGRIAEQIVTIPEGWRIEQVGQALEDSEVTVASEFVSAAAGGGPAYDFVRDRPEGSPSSLEGFLFPDTYHLPKEASPGTVIDIMLQNWDRRVPDDLRELALDREMTLYEVVTLASIVEREAVKDEERPLIAGVYLNRLEKGMYLQSDPSVQYAKGYSEETGRWWNPMIQEEAITVVSSYNTFLNPGLPPGPICSPGYASIKAVLQPEESEYLFFYSRGDGYHAFAVTYEEHLRNEEIYAGQR